MSGYRIIFVGAPGSGKGTQAQRLLERHGAQQISTGDILRQARKDGTALGEEAQKYMDEGKLVPDELIINLIKDTLGAGKFSSGWVLDGFPRTLAQAEALDRMLTAMGEKITHVVVLDVPAAVLLERIVGRRSCPKCGNSYLLEKTRKPRGKDHIQVLICPFSSPTAREVSPSRVVRAVIRR